ncbi:disulfide bond formation protein B [Acinetobacter sp. SwsAc6]|uniref:Disulfide bond formation protein B n=1 Tax=Acinetobacter cumulans TaxID=2136182 RepID=A0A498CZE3_9GAMM|nr:MULTISPECIES: disulfide bond formation protein B [Acinetobacter]NWK73261.1 disulfide bond formation protein B [Acinetobacter sp. SwsAc6]RFS35226.1 disulfide bond formation protein B [Acinetobacter sp. SWAC5]RKG45399.1 disulfide bond formation protein B [Acinetobacter cumulans]RLL36985.1 disulfide bond formation protein B [Acinetobacter cumulans]RZG60302.1 disulfide bond formation protein B [Acinetobacter sp. WCHAc060006]
MQWSYRLISGLLFVASVIGMSFALYLEHVQGLEPCPLCVFQRIGLIGLGLISLLACLHNPASNVMKRIYAFLASVSILWSVGVAARHVWLQNLPPDKVPSCGPGLDYWVETLPLKSVFQQVLTGSGECAKVDWTFLGQSLPVWSGIFFAVLAVVSLWQLCRRYPA